MKPFQKSSYQYQQLYDYFSQKEDSYSRNLFRFHNCFDNDNQNINILQKMDKNWQVKCNECFLYDQNNLRVIKLSDFTNNPIQQLINNEIINKVQSYTQILQNDFLRNFSQTLTFMKDSLTTVQRKGFKLAQSVMKQINDRIQFDLFQNKINQARNCNTRQENQNLMKSINDEINKLFSYDVISLYLYEIEQFIGIQKQEVNLIMQNMEQIQSLLIQQLDKLKQYCYDLDQIQQQILKLIMKQNGQLLIKDIQEFPSVQYLINQGKSFKCELIYQGSRDGLSCEEYWKRCDLQENLLTIMTSENGNVFGGYSPCILDCSIPQYLQDPSFQSFIFQYNKKQIYKLKNQQYAVYANRDYGPTYGNGHDLTINSDFQYGSTSNFGMAYDTSEYQIVDKYTHLFGDFNPKLVECKVYKIKFT
ncbi:hypothetical protein pb186bvf_007453 [Paramecium bursaria]